MSLDTFGGLKTAVGTWLNRSDLTGYIPDFVRLAEQRIYYGSDGQYQSQPLRVPAMTTTETGTITGSTIAFPTRFLEPQRVVASSGGSSWTLLYMAPERYTEHANSSAVPTAYTYRNNAIYVSGTGAASYTLDYYQAFASLTADADTNWVLANTPGIYLYASLIEAVPFIGDSANAATWLMMLNSSIAAANRATKYQGGGALATRVVR